MTKQGLDKNETVVRGMQREIEFSITTFTHLMLLIMMIAELWLWEIFNILMVYEIFEIWMRNQISNCSPSHSHIFILTIYAFQIRIALTRWAQLSEGPLRCHFTELNYLPSNLAERTFHPSQIPTVNSTDSQQLGRQITTKSRFRAFSLSSRCHFRIYIFQF